MKVFNTIVTIFAVCGIIYCMYAIYKGKQLLYIDNPTNQDITVQVEGTPELLIKAREYDTINLKEGKYSVKMNGEDVGEFVRKKGDAYALLNPTRSYYMKDYIVYTDKDSVDESKLPKTKIIKFYGEDLQVYEASNDLYVNFKPDYALDEYFPTTLKTGGNIFTQFFFKTEELKSKIYRASDFIVQHYEISEEEIEQLIDEGRKQNNKEKEKLGTETQQDS